MPSNQKNLKHGPSRGYDARTRKMKDAEMTDSLNFTAKLAMVFRKFGGNPGKTADGIVVGRAGRRRHAAQLRSGRKYLAQGGER